MQYTQYYIKIENETLLDTVNTIGIRDKGLLKINEDHHTLKNNTLYFFSHH